MIFGKRVCKISCHNRSSEGVLILSNTSKIAEFHPGDLTNGEGYDERITGCAL